MLLTFILSGCGSKEAKTDESKDSNENMGRYVETEIALPEGEEAVSIVEDENKDFILFTKYYGEESLTIKRYKLDGDTWKEEEASWLQDILDKFLPEQTFSGELSKVIYGADHNYYAIVSAYAEASSRDYIFRSGDGIKDYEQMNIEYLDEVADNQDGYTRYNSATDIRVTEDGTMFLYDYMKDAFVAFTSEGEKINKVDVMGSFPNAGMFNNPFVSGNELIGLKSSGTEIAYIDGESLEESNTIKIDKSGASTSLYQLEDKTLIMADASGIHRLQDGGTLWETVVDGDLNTMSMPNANIMELIAQLDDGTGSGETYYILYQDGQGDSLIKYTFDPDIVSVPGEELTIYSLYDNATVRQAIALFQRKNQNVKVNYVVAMPDGEGNKEENIKALNNELISGNGADLLVLDGLPATSFIQKGVLMDISEICNKADLLENVREAYTEDGKIYRMPTKIQIPLINGNKEVIASAESLNDMVNYAKAHEELPYVNNVGMQQVAQEFLRMEASSFITPENTLDTEALRQFLKNLNYLKANKCMVDDDGAFSFFGSNQYGLKMGDTLAAWDSISNISNLFVEQALCKGTDLDFGSAENAFFAIGPIGINSSTKKADLASDFISFILSDDIQKTDVSDGFPVCKTSWNKIVQKEQKDMYYGISYQLSDGTYASLEGEYPSKETREKFAKIAESVTKPVEKENGFVDLLLDEMSGFLAGANNIDQTIQSAESTCNRYLSEQQGNY